MSPRWLLALSAGVVLLACAGTCLTVIQQDEIGIVQRFGAVLDPPYEPGLHLGWPWGVDRVTRLKRDQARTLRVGASGLEAAPLSRSPDSSSDDFLSGDLNLVTAEALVQYRVEDPVKYQFASASADDTLAAISQAALARALASRGIDHILTVGRGETSEALRAEVQAGSEALGLGVSIRAVRLGRVAPPAAVAPAFADADRARSDRRQAVTKAEEYRDRAEADARGQAREIADQAAGTIESRIQAARGDADRFTKILAEVRTNPIPARQRLYLDAVAELLPRLNRKIVVPANREIDLSVISEK